MSNYSVLDTVVLALYMLVLMGMGIYLSKKRAGGEMYNRKSSLGTFVLIATVCATMVGGSDVIGTGGVAYSRTLDIFVMSLPYPIGIMVFSLMSGRVQKLGAQHNIRSIPQLMERRFGRRTRYLAAVIICFATAATAAASISAIANMFTVIGETIGISYEVAAIVATLVIVVYTIVSGFAGVVWTDVIQFIVMSITVFLLLPTVTVIHGGGFAEIFSKATPQMLSVNIDGFFISNLFINIIFTFCAAEIWQRAFSAKSPKAATRGVAGGAAFFTITLAIVCLLGMAGYIMFPDLSTSDAVIPTIIIKLLPTGVSGLVLAGLLSVAMSSGDSYVQLASQTLADDILRTRFPKMTVEKEKLIYRCAIAVFACIGLVIALYIRGVYDALMFALGFYSSCMGFPAIGALIWKKATKQGIVCSILAGLIVAIGWTALGEPFGFNMAVPAGVASLLALIFVSLATYRKSPSKVLEVK